MREIVLDTETTGLKPEEGHRIIEIGAVELVNRRLTGNTFHAYINPERHIEAGALAVHGITHEFLADKPTFKDVITPFMEFIGGAQLVIHNAPFDVGFIDYEFKRLATHWQRVTDHCQVLDTLQMARQKHPGQKNSLDALCKRYEIDNSERSLHGALLDARILALVYLAMTGGQGNLFADELEPVTMNRKTQVRKKIKIERGILKVLKANELELEAHGAFMEKVKKE